MLFELFAAGCAVDGGRAGLAHGGSHDETRAPLPGNRSWSYDDLLHLMRGAAGLCPGSFPSNETKSTTSFPGELTECEYSTGCHLVYKAARTVRKYGAEQGFSSLRQDSEDVPRTQKPKAEVRRCEAKMEAENGTEELGREPRCGMSRRCGSCKSWSVAVRLSLSQSSLASRHGPSCRDTQTSRLGSGPLTM
ncbi:hypothetical protein CPLU01_07626 [Colletotrichum plurivorum]|uniref:Uncharacterized protein n=1 Tax=Colletotrichum plurivorum TaxID=2175906 RepID=A0A8H6NEW3_9PEZI|nr:hypothetical protein CPLU01_07626 [Colletotrichum plurivorum]